MFYVDTSALVPMFIREPRSEALVEWLEAREERLAISEWSLVEFASAAAIKVRSGSVTASLARNAIAQASAFARNRCTVPSPREEEFRRAAELAGEAARGLRAGDALHLAMAQALDVQGILCLDEAMCESARALGIDVVTF